MQAEGGQAEVDIATCPIGVDVPAALLTWLLARRRLLPEVRVSRTGQKPISTDPFKGSLGLKELLTDPGACLLQRLTRHLHVDVPNSAFKLRLNYHRAGQRRV